ncbi:MAG: isoprenylcysteine carboxylmethyltransferase family protein [Candidatus Lokiarchaeota archaeon]|nr:isoprenylcysteine carboxylmethyltransferase family protein [Candidatus Harpocratesius repetitus]
MKQENHNNADVKKIKGGMIIRIAVWVLMMFGGAILGIIIDQSLFPFLWKSILFHILSFIPGVFLMWAVFRISKVTGRFLARFGREGDIPRMETNKLVTDGIYGCMRHPMHLGLLFFPFSFALLIGSPTFIIIIAPLEMLFILMLIKIVEEPEAIAKFGDDYLNYMKKVPMFNFRIKCLKYLFNLEKSQK